MNPETLVPLILLLIGGLLALLCLFFALRAARHKRLLDNLPTSKTTGVFIGLVELKGTAEATEPLRSFLADISCVLYRWNVEEKWSKLVTETHTDAKGNRHTRTRTESGWKTVASGGESIPFYLKDDAGILLIQPEGADLRTEPVFSLTCQRDDPLYYGKGPAFAVAHSDHRRRFSEQAIPLHRPLYVIGQARERRDVVAAEVALDPAAPLFIISTHAEEKVASGLAWKHAGLGILGLVLLAGALFLRELHGPGGVYTTTLAGAAAYAGAWLLGWIAMAFNSLVDLRQRVRQAWANVDVHLKRRHDLIPQLVEIAKGLKDHERGVQTEVAALRTQMTATPPGQPGPDPSGCAPVVAVLAERYPELKASPAFLSLQRELAGTEDRISLARAYFNDIATFYNTRLETVPDRFIAALGAMQPQPLLAADGFEREPVRVNLAE